MANAPAPALPSRSDLARAECISRGGFANPDVLRIECEGRALAVKDFAPRAWLVRSRQSAPMRLPSPRWHPGPTALRGPTLAPSAMVASGPM